MRGTNVEKVAVKHFITRDFQAAESMKTLRTNLLFCGDSVKAVALTSFSSSEGKSTLAFHLAISLAQTGRRILLLDTDLRKSVLATRLRVRGRVEGLSHFLSGMSNASDLIYATDLPNLYIMFAGVRIPNPSEALGSDRFGQLIQALKGTFDYIIVDAAPIGQVVDCAVIAPVVDGVMMVIDSTHNSYKLERRVKAQLEKSGGKILGVILNRVDFKDKGSYYGKAYSYGGYGYGGGPHANKSRHRSGHSTELL